MNLSRILNYNCLFSNKFHQSSSFYPVIKVKELTIAPSVSFSSCYSCKDCIDTKKLTLTPFSSLIYSCRGMKVRGSLQLRCKDCYFVRKDGVMYVQCSSYPRHKQRGLTKRPKYSWILTYAFQSKIQNDLKKSLKSWK